MTPDDVTVLLNELFEEGVRCNPPESWQVEDGNSRLLLLLSEDQTWLRVLISIAQAQDAQPFLQQLLEANFDETQETRYALYQQVLWGVFQHPVATLTLEDLRQAIARLVQMQRKGLSDTFNQVAEAQIRQIIYAAKLQGQSLESTMKTLERFYHEGVMGEISQEADQRDTVLEAWRYQLERLWNEVADEA
ncbi:MAG: hypothetical protein WBA57_23645 [Elainellaceae cyanobacterium]